METVHRTHDLLTVNRRWLMNKVKRGKAEVCRRYRVTDDYQYDNASNFGKTEWLPARIRSPKYEEFTEDKITVTRCTNDDRLPGYFNLDACIFGWKSGRAYWNDDDDTITLTGAGECYTFRILA